MSQEAQVSSGPHHHRGRHLLCSAPTSFAPFQEIHRLHKLPLMIWHYGKSLGLFGRGILRVIGANMELGTGSVHSANPRLRSMGARLCPVCCVIHNGRHTARHARYRGNQSMNLPLRNSRSDGMRQTCKHAMTMQCNKGCDCGSKGLMERHMVCLGVKKGFLE